MIIFEMPASTVFVMIRYWMYPHKLKAKTDQLLPPLLFSAALERMPNITEIRIMKIGKKGELVS